MGCLGFIGGHRAFGICEGDTGKFGVWGGRGGIWHIKNRPTAWLSNTQHTALLHGFGPSLDTYINIISSQ